MALEYAIDGYKSTGVLFLRDAEIGSTFYMSDAKIISVYGEKFKSAIASCEDFAIYFSSSEPYEIAVFKCLSRNDADEILKMCFERSDDKKVGLRFTGWEQASKAIIVSEYRNYVIFIFADSQLRSDGAYERIIEAIR